MKKILEKLKSVVVDLEHDRGSFLVFALFVREDDPERWDIVVSASWLRSDRIEAYKILAKKIQESLTEAEWLRFSRIVILDQCDPVVLFLQSAFSIKNGLVEMVRGNLFSGRFKFSIKHAYLLRCQK